MSPLSSDVRDVLARAHALRWQLASLAAMQARLYLDEEDFFVQGRDLGLQRVELQEMLDLRQGQTHTILKRLREKGIRPLFQPGPRAFYIPDHQMDEFVRRHANGESFFDLSFGTPYTPDRIRRQMTAEGHDTRNPLMPTAGQRKKGETHDAKRKWSPETRLELLRYVNVFMAPASCAPGTWRTSSG